jgi:hypothetical protein
MAKLSTIAPTNDADLAAWREAWEERFRSELAAAHARIGAAHRELVLGFDDEATVLERAVSIIGNAGNLPRLSDARTAQDLDDITEHFGRNLGTVATRHYGTARTWSDETPAP